MGKRVAYETMQFFELDVPTGIEPEDYIGTKDFIEQCASLVQSGFIEFQVQEILDDDEVVTPFTGRNKGHL